jgi:glycosyltransferase involved in cell wall biosynthesis
MIPERDARAIAERLELYAAEPAMLVTDGLALRRRICREFDVRKRAACLAGIYDAVRAGANRTEEACAV